MNSMNSGNSVWKDIQQAFSLNLYEEMNLGITFIGNSRYEWKVQGI